MVFHGSASSCLVLQSVGGYDVHSTDHRPVPVELTPVLHTTANGLRQETKRVLLPGRGLLSGSNTTSLPHTTASLLAWQSRSAITSQEAVVCADFNGIALGPTTSELSRYPENSDFSPGTARLSRKIAVQFR